ncbi:MAG: DUF2550 domain-containing protein [Gordonia sp. (in: high G+C Gram-positive bacteria)]|uniref:DUF2550 domain-containing protein n=1 Tax=Gordonia sp. (in: high G+C Gram-positive bacteria) TaxID=84139 RepID=UPI003C71AA13
MPFWIWIVVIVVIGALLIAAGVVYRVLEVRSAGTPVLMRTIPADAEHGWRHGSVHYGEDSLAYYRLRSLRPGPTIKISRRRIEVLDRRSPVGTELEIMDPDFRIVEIAVGRTSTSDRYELAMGLEVSTAFQSWIEARQPRRARRRPAA